MKNTGRNMPPEGAMGNKHFQLTTGLFANLSDFIEGELPVRG